VEVGGLRLRDHAIGRRRAREWRGLPELDLGIGRARPVFLLGGVRADGDRKHGGGGERLPFHRSLSLGRVCFCLFGSKEPRGAAASTGASKSARGGGGKRQGGAVRCSVGAKIVGIVACD
jgi:hypothetical protein